MIQSTRTITIASVTLLLCTALAPACSFVSDPFPLGIQGKRAKVSDGVALHGTLVKVDTLRATEACSDFPNVDSRLHFRVEKAFGSSADAGDTLVIATPISSASCGVEYPLGTEAIVFAGRLEASHCRKPAGMLWTSLMSENIRHPTRSQLDTLYGATASIRNGAAVSRSALGRDGRGFGLEGGRMTLDVPGGSALDAIGADGRVAVPP